MSLRCLVLNDVVVSSNTIQTLLGDLTLLEEFTLCNCAGDQTLLEKMRNYVGDHDVRIHAPNLKILRLRGNCFKSIHLIAPLLRELSVDFATNLASKKNSVCTYSEVLGGLSSLEVLKGSFNFFKYLSIGLDSSKVSLEFPHLRLIEVTQNAFYDKKVLSVVARLSKDTPNLHKIRVKYSYTCYSQSGSLSLNSECLSSFTFEQLKVIEFCPVGQSPNFMKLIKWILASSPVLETLIYDARFEPDRELLKQTSTLLAFPRASPNAKILLGKR